MCYTSQEKKTNFDLIGWASFFMCFSFFSVSVTLQVRGQWTQLTTVVTAVSQEITGFQPFRIPYIWKNYETSNSSSGTELSELESWILTVSLSNIHLWRKNRRTKPVKCYLSDLQGAANEICLRWLSGN